jgi:hypothetical protein
MAYVAHAGVHFLLGGASGSTNSVFSCENWSTSLSGIISDDNLKAIKSQSAFLLRNIWRYDLCSTPTYEDCVGLSASEAACKLTCSGCENDKFTTKQLKALTQWFRDLWVTTTPTDDELQAIAKVVFCDSKVLVGEHVEASSPIDYSFWPMHPTLERLVHYKQLVKPFSDYTWDASGYQSDWTSECKWGATFNTDCKGHGSSDLTVGKMLVLDAKSGKFVSKYLTNHEIMQLTLPDKTSMLPYVYDFFDYSHCEEEGITFASVR